MNVTVTINAPELATAIQALAAALSNLKPGFIETKVQQDFAHQTAPAAPPIQGVPVSNPAPVVPPIQGVPVSNPAPVVPPVAPPPQQPQTVPTTAPVYTMEQLAVAATQLVDGGRRAELVQLLAEFGVQALTGLPKEQYGAFATRLRGMGAKI